MSQGQCCNSQELTEEQMVDQLDGMLDGHVGKDGALIPALQQAQKTFGSLPIAGLKKISLILDVSYSEVAGVVSFYSFFSTVPRGKYIVRVCLGTACYVRGGKEVLAAFQRELGIGVGDTTEDRQFSLDVGRCFGACGLAPVIMVNDDVHQRVKPSKVAELLNSYKDVIVCAKEAS